VLRNPLVRRFKAPAAIVAGLASSPHYPVRLSPSASFLACVDLKMGPGAFVSGLDAGEGAWRNLFENPTTVQFDHCVLAMTTYLATALLFVSSLRAAVRAALPHSRCAPRRRSASPRCCTSCRYRSPQRTKQAASRCSWTYSTCSWHYAGQVPLRGRGDRQI